ncbi:MAG: helix-turn-helix domain-containing protein [Bacilli bacterium]|nr:helix-turn-helix domain-containing protein [Bacilli bacterium]
MSTEFRLYDVDEKDLYENKTKEEKEAILLDMVEYALKYGNKPAARYYNTYPSTVRRWVKKYKENGKEGLKFK